MTYREERLNYWIKRITFKIKENEWRPGRPLLPLMLSREECFELMSILRHYKNIMNQESIEDEAAKLQKAYNKGFEDCRQAVIKWRVNNDRL